MLASNLLELLNSLPAHRLKVPCATISESIHTVFTQLDAALQKNASPTAKVNGNKRHPLINAAPMSAACQPKQRTLQRTTALTQDKDDSDTFADLEDK